MMKEWAITSRKVLPGATAGSAWRIAGRARARGSRARSCREAGCSVPTQGQGQECDRHVTSPRLRCGQSTGLHGRRLVLRREERRRHAEAAPRSSSRSARRKASVAFDDRPSRPTRKQGRHGLRPSSAAERVGVRVQAASASSSRRSAASARAVAGRRPAGPRAPRGRERAAAGCGRRTGSVWRVVLQSRCGRSGPGPRRPSRPPRRSADCPSRSRSAIRGNGPSRGPPPRQAVHEVHATRFGMTPGRVAAVEQRLHRARAHARRSRPSCRSPTCRRSGRRWRVHAAREAHRVLERFLAMGQRVAHGLAHQARQLAPSARGPGRGAPRCRRAAAAGRSPASTRRRGRGPCARPCPPYVSWPSWMIRPTSARPALHLVEDPVEGHDARAAPPGAKSFRARKAEVQGAGHRDGRAGAGLDGVQRLAGHQQRTVAVADAAPARHERVLVGDVRVGVERDGRDLVPALLGLAVQGLDVGAGRARPPGRR